MHYIHLLCMLVQFKCYHKPGSPHVFKIVKSLTKTSCRVSIKAIYKLFEVGKNTRFSKKWCSVRKYILLCSYS